MNKDKQLVDLQPVNGQIINSTIFDGPMHMASDVLMLQKLSERVDISIRFYKWEGIWLSIGKHQKDLPKSWINLVKEQKLNIVRRPSGGNAVLHSGGLTYALTWRSAPRRRHQAYLEASQWLINCFDEIGLHLSFGNQSQSTSSRNCFSTSTIADLVDEDGIKRIGSAQLWKNGNLLQHGEILLDPPIELWMQIFNQKPPLPNSIKIRRSGLEKILIKALKSYWSEINWIHTKFGSNEIKEIQQNSKNYLVNLSSSDC